MAFTLPSPQSIINTLAQTVQSIPLVQAYNQNQQANANLAAQEAYARQQDAQIAQMQKYGQYPIARQGTNNAPVYINPTTGRYQSTPVGQPLPTPTTAQVPTNTPLGSNVGGGNNLITQGDINLGASIPGVKDFTFNYTAETTAAYDALKDFYQKLLDFAQGDVDLAKRVLEYTYQQGMREATQANEEQVQSMARSNPTETAGLMTSLNRRGVVSSGFGKKEAENLKAEQDLRALQVQRALENQTSRLTNARETGLQEQENKLAQTKFELERQRRKEAEQAAMNKRQIQGDIYNTELDKAQQAEQRRVQGISNNTLTGLLGGGETSKPTGTTVTRDGATGQVADASGRLYGGWYNNPTTGKNQRYWGNGQWTDS